MGGDALAAAATAHAKHLRSLAALASRLLANWAYALPTRHRAAPHGYHHMMRNKKE